MTWSLGTAVLVLGILRVEGALNEKSLILECPSNTYMVNRTQSSKKTMITVKTQRDICERIIQDRSLELISNDDLLPLRSLIKINGEYYLKFTWRSSVVDGKYPRRFLLLLEYTIPDQKLQWDCVVLELNRRKAEKHETFTELSFHCIKLSEGTNADVSIQVWNYSQRQYNTGCRKPRSLGHHNTCTRVECSDERHHSLALESYKTEICSCYAAFHGTPKFEIDIITKNGIIGFILNVTNLPDFLASMKIEVLRNGANVWNETFDSLMTSPIFENGTIQFITSGIKQFPGNYTLVMVGGCYNDRTFKDKSHECSIDFSYFQYITEVTTPLVKETENPNRSRSLLLVVGILSGVAVAASFTTTVFVVYIRMYKQRTSNRSPQHYTQAPNNTSQSQHDTFSHEMTELINVRTLEQRKKVLLLYHPPDLNPTLKQVITQLNMELVDGRNGNWQTFAMDAVLKYQNVVILMSTGLFELLYGSDSEKEARRVERQYEQVTELVMQNLNLLTASVPNRDDFFVHLVSTNCDGGRGLISRFLPKCEFLRQTENYCVYYVTNSPSVQLTDDSEFNKLKDKLEHSFAINS